jgi:hypothetical protein
LQLCGKRLGALDLPFITTPLVANEFDCSTQTARNRLAVPVEDRYLTRIDLSQRRVVWCGSDDETATDVANALREHFDLTDVDTDHSPRSPRSHTACFRSFTRTAGIAR